MITPLLEPPSPVYQLLSASLYVSSLPSLLTKPSSPRDSLSSFAVHPTLVVSLVELRDFTQDIVQVCSPYNQLPLSAAS